MRMTYREGRREDAEVCGAVFHEAFKHIAEQHNFPVDFPEPETAVSILTMLLSRDDLYSVIAEGDGVIVGSNFLWESDSIAGVGPITVMPSAQNASIGRQLMEHVLERAPSKRFAGVRLVQSAYHNRSLSLYTKWALMRANRSRSCRDRRCTSRSPAMTCGRLKWEISKPAIVCAPRSMASIGEENYLAR
jgi:predicted N-acetyltransferase YhbS